jgi:hypothetical protein
MFRRMKANWNGRHAGGGSAAGSPDAPAVRRRAALATARFMKRNAVRAVALRDTISTPSGNEPKVVQKSTTKGNFLVDDCAANALNSEAPEDISPKTVVAEELGRSRR